MGVDSSCNNLLHFGHGHGRLRHKIGRKKKVLRIACSGGQNVPTLGTSRFHPIRRPYLPYGDIVLLRWPILPIIGNFPIYPFLGGSLLEPMGSARPDGPNRL